MRDAGASHGSEEGEGGVGGAGGAGGAGSAGTSGAGIDPVMVDAGEEVCGAVEAGGGGRGSGVGSVGRVGVTPDGRLMTGRLAGLGMWSAVVTLAWPVLAEQCLNSLVGLTDTVLAAQISEAATDAVGGAAYVVWFLGLITAALGVGATALVSRSIGKGRMAVADAAVGQTLLLGAVSGAVVGAGLWASTGWVGAALSLTGEGREALRGYMGVIALGVVPMSVLYSGIACLRGSGDTRGPLGAMVVVNVVNIVVSWALSGVDLSRARVIDGVVRRVTVLENPFGIDMGVRGVAAGTVIAEVIGAAIVIGLLVRGRRGVTLRARRLRPHGHTMRRLVRVGAPNFVESAGMWLGNFVVILMVGWLGAERAGVGGHGGGGGMLGSHILAVRIEALSFLPGFSMGVAAATLCGQYLGAGAPGLARAAAIRCMLVAGAIMGCMGVMFEAIPREIVGVFSGQATHLAVTPECLRVAGLAQVPFAVMLVLRAAMHGAGDVRAVMVLTWCSTYLVRVPLAFALSGADLRIGGMTLANPFGLEGGLRGLWVALCVEMTVRSVLFAARFWSGAWAKAKV